MNSRQQAERLLDLAGIKINGPRPWDLQVNDNRLYDRVLSGGSLALGESYTDGWWDAADLSEFFSRIMRSNLREHISDYRLWLSVAVARAFNRQDRRRSLEVGKRHYDVGNDLYQAMLGRTMVYSCGYWRTADTLDDAQDAKMDLICRKIGLRSGDKLLDIGCGWGSFAKFAAEKYGAEVTGVTISAQQKAFADELTRGLPVKILLQDYRDIIDVKYDHIVSIGMFEHIGTKNYAKFFGKVASLLEDDGLLLLHTIGTKRPQTVTDPWIDKYIFPNGVMPTIGGIGGAFNQYCMTLEDFHSFGFDYVKTLQSWHANVESAWAHLDESYDDKFRRMWSYYLLSSAATFKSRTNDLWQFVISKDGLLAPYTSVR